MNLIRGGLKKSKTPYPTVWVNTWQFAQLGESETLFVSVLQGIVDGLAEQVPREFSAQVEKVTRFMAWAAVSVAAHVTENQTGIPVTRALPGGAPPARHRLAAELKTSLHDLVGVVRKNHERVVLFIDDLDRVPPCRAVQILEALKNFLDVPGLVTVLACDYGVIVRGLPQRMGVSESDLGRSFFDKIIQVPFRMPVHVYKANSYVGELLKRIGVAVEGRDLEKITNVLRYSVGLNPRALKRHANTLLLLVKVAAKTHSFATKKEQLEGPLVMLSLTAMESKYPELHAFLAGLARQQDDGALLQVLSGDLSPAADEVWLEKYAQPDAEDGPDSIPKVAITDPKLSRFLAAFRDLVDRDGDNKLNAAELALLCRMFDLSAVSSVGEVKRKSSPRRKRPWTAEEYVADVAKRMAAEPPVVEVHRRLVELFQRLHRERVLKLHWGKGTQMGSMVPKIDGLGLLQAYSNGAINAGPCWIWIKAKESGREAIIEGLERLTGDPILPRLQVEDPEDWWFNLTPILVERDPQLHGLEAWLRSCAQLLA